MRFDFRCWVLILLLLPSCTAYKKVLFMQDPDKPQERVYPTLLSENVIRIQPEDVLSITVNIAGAQEVAHDFNLPLQPVASSYGTGDFVDMSVGRQTYKVDGNGDVILPVCGKIKVAGYTVIQLQDKISEMLKAQYLVEGSDKTPIVTVQLTNFYIGFLGEYNRQIKVDREHINIFEAMSLARVEMGMGSSRVVTLIRPQPDGSQKHVRLDLSKIDIVASPYYYLHQNDMIYIQPTRLRINQFGLQNLTIFTSVASFIISTISIVLYFRSLSD
jgi:polysaccharide export outer membrane protein